MSSDKNGNGQSGHTVWADAALVTPALRTFCVFTEETPGRENPLYIDAHSVTCLDDAAHFYVYRPTNTAEGVLLTAFALRIVRPYLDVQDITPVLAATSNVAN